MHHGVDITDSAIIAAANCRSVISRTASCRIRPSILVDEAASRIRMEIDSKPEAMDKLERRLIQLKIEREAVKKDDACQGAGRSTWMSKSRSSSASSPIWKKSGRPKRPLCKAAAQVKSDLEQVKLRWRAARRAGDLTRNVRAAVRQVSPSWRSSWKKRSVAETAEHTLLRNKVTEEEVAEVVSRWTGIPISKMLEGDREKLLRMEDDLHEPCGGSGRGGSRSIQRSASFAGWAVGPQPPQRFIPVPGPNRRR